MAALARDQTHRTKRVKAVIGGTPLIDEVMRYAHLIVALTAAHTPPRTPDTSRSRSPTAPPPPPAAPDAATRAKWPPRARWWAPPTAACDASATVPMSRRSSRPTPSTNTPCTATTIRVKRKTSTPTSAISDQRDTMPISTKKKWRPTEPRGPRYEVHRAARIRSRQRARHAHGVVAEVHPINGRAATKAPSTVPTTATRGDSIMVLGRPAVYR